MRFWFVCGDVVILIGLLKQVEEVNDSGPGPVLYGFYKAPVLDTVTTWSETRNTTVQVDSHEASLL